jgi:hypothetical protein
MHPVAAVATVSAQAAAEGRGKMEMSYGKKGPRYRGPFCFVAQYAVAGRFG